MEKKYLKPSIQVAVFTAKEVLCGASDAKINPNEKITDSDQFGSKSRQDNSDGWSGGLW